MWEIQGENDLNDIISGFPMEKREFGQEKKEELFLGNGSEQVCAYRITLSRQWMPPLMRSSCVSTGSTW